MSDGITYTRFQDIPQFTCDGNWECNFGIESVWGFIVDHQKTCGLNIDPDFQRCHVWTEEQQIAWLEFHLQGGRTARVLYFNSPSWHSKRRVCRYDEFVIVDGKQRLEAIRRFTQNEIRVFGSLFSEFTDSIRLTHTMKININDLKSRAEVLRWYLQFNSGGIVHTPEEIDRVRVLLEKELATD